MSKGGAKKSKPGYSVLIKEFKMEKLIKMLKDSGQLLIKNYMIGLPVAIAMLVSLIVTLFASLTTAAALSFLTSILVGAAVLITVVSADGLISKGKFDHMKSLNMVVGKAVPLVLLYLAAVVVAIVIFGAAFVLSVLIFKSAGLAGVLFYGIAGLIWLWIMYAYFSFADMIVLFENKQVPDVFNRNNDIVKSSTNLVVMYFVLCVLASWVFGIVAAVIPGAVGTILMYVLETVLLVWLFVTVRYQVYKQIAMKGASKK
jgi:hypothetical protein